MDKEVAVIYNEWSSSMEDHFETDGIEDAHEELDNLKKYDEWSGSDYKLFKKAAALANLDVKDIIDIFVSELKREL